MEQEVFTSLTVWGHSHPSQSALKHKERKQSQSAEPQAVASFAKRGACQLHSEADGTEEFTVETKAKAVFLLHSELNTGGASARDNPSHLGDLHRVTHSFPAQHIEKQQ